MAYSGQRRIAFEAGFNAALFGRDNANPYNKDTVAGSFAAYDDGYDKGLLSDIPPRGPQGETGATGDSGTNGSPGQTGAAGQDGNQHFVGNGAPSNGLGNNGDIYTDADNGDIYEKIGGSWSLQGEPGSMALTIRTDTIDPDAAIVVTYRGDALPGTSEAGATWRVQRMTEQTDTDIDIVFADGDDDFNNVWDNRLSLSYS